MKNKAIEIQIPEFDNVNSLDTSEEDIEVYNLSQEAKKYLISHSWCDGIEEGWLVAGWGYIYAIFLFKIKPAFSNVDDYVWIVVGDIPPAYIDIESARNPKEVVECYISIMSDWVECVQNGDSVEDCYPVEVPATKEYADMLSNRLKIIEEEIKTDLE